MALLIEEQVGGNLTDDMSRYTLNQLIHDWVTTLVETSNPFEALMTIAANQIFALVIAAVRAALTDPVYAQLKCIFYDNILEDLSFDSDGWEAVRSEITSVIGGVAGIFLEHLVYLLGVVGLTNLARSQAATEGDCGSCDCLVDCVDTWIVFFGTALEMSGCNIQAASDLDGSHATIALDYDGTHGCRLDAVGVISGTFTGYTQYYLADGSGPFTNMLGFPTGLNLSNCTFVGNDSTPFSLSTDWSPIPP
jgi:hypothetical protein